MKLADRMSRIGTESAFDVLARARALEAEGREIVHLQIGEPDFDTPAHVTEAGIQALRDGYTHYVPALGIPQLRDAIAEHISQTRGIDVQRRTSYSRLSHSRGGSGDMNTTWSS